MESVLCESLCSSDLFEKNLTKIIVISTKTGTITHINATLRQDKNAPKKKSANPPNDPNNPALANKIPRIDVSLCTKID